MFIRTKFTRWIRHEYLAEIILIINIIIIIHLCNIYYEHTGNQYILKETDSTGEFCPLYPSTLQGKRIDESESRLND